jgi:hypothetical protein
VGVGVCPDVLAWTKEEEETEPDKVSECFFAGSEMCPGLNLYQSWFGDLGLLRLWTVTFFVTGLLPVESEI